MLFIRERGADDCGTAMTPNEVSERLKLSSLQDKLWNVVPSCATTGEGLFEGLVCIPLPRFSTRKCLIIFLGLAVE